MTDEAKKVVETLRNWNLTVGTHGLIKLSDLLVLQQAADMIEELFKEAQNYAAKAVICDKLQEVSEFAIKERDEWKRKAEAAEKDITRMLISDDVLLCDYCKSINRDDCVQGSMECVKNAGWRGPCAENGGKE